jgi:hypothetical protein
MVKATERGPLSEISSYGNREMPLVVGGLAIAFIALTMLTLISLYWILTKWHDFAIQIPVAGQALADVGDRVRDVNGEIIADVVGVAHTVISWSVDRVMDGFKILHDIFNAVIEFNVIDLVNRMASLTAVITGVIAGQIAALQASFGILNGFVHGFLQLNVEALNFWKLQTVNTLNNYILPNLAALITTTNTIARVMLPSLQHQLDALTAETLAWVNGIVKPMRVELSNLQQTLTAVIYDPIRGIIPRVGGLEGTMAQVLPWAATIGLSIPIARTLARVGRNPCTCLEEEGQTDMIPMLFWLFEEIG